MQDSQPCKIWPLRKAAIRESNKGFACRIFWKPYMSDYVAAGTFCSQKNGPQIFEAPHVWLRCRRRFFFSEKYSVSPNNHHEVPLKPWRLLGALSFLVLFFSWRLLSFPFGVMTLIRWRALGPTTLIECSHDAYWICSWRLLSLLMTLIALPMALIELAHDVY